MRDTLKNVALALASCGALTAPTLAQPLERLHDNLRARVGAEVRDPDAAADQVRELLRDDPSFQRLLEHFRTASLAVAPRGSGAEDAAQETLLKIWKGRPAIFLRPHAEVIRYLRSATQRNLWTGIRRSKAAEERERHGENANDFGPADTAAAHDLVEALRERIDADARAVLESLLTGASSEREIAAALGRTRYSVSKSCEEIQRALSTLL